MTKSFSALSRSLGGYPLDRGNLSARAKRGCVLLARSAAACCSREARLRVARAKRGCVLLAPKARLRVARAKRGCVLLAPKARLRVARVEGAAGVALAPAARTKPRAAVVGGSGVPDAVESCPEPIDGRERRRAAARADVAPGDREPNGSRGF